MIKKCFQMQETVVLVFLMTVRWTQTPLYAK